MKKSTLLGAVAIVAAVAAAFSTSSAVAQDIVKIGKDAKTNDGAWALPEGAAYYANRLKVSTTTSQTADQIHQIGLDELARIQGEMRQIIDKVGFKGSLQEFFAELKR